MSKCTVGPCGEHVGSKLAALTEHLEATAPMHLAVAPLALVRLAACKPARAPAFAYAVFVEFLLSQAWIFPSAWLANNVQRVQYSNARLSRPRTRRCPLGPCSIFSWSHYAASLCRCSYAVDEKGDCLALERETNSVCAGVSFFTHLRFVTFSSSDESLIVFSTRSL